MSSIRSARDVVLRAGGGICGHATQTKKCLSDGWFRDIHSHILWGLDDGAKDFEMSVAMLRIARDPDHRYSRERIQIFSTLFSPTKSM